MLVIVTPNLGSSIYTSGLSIHEKNLGARNLTITKTSRAFQRPVCAKWLAWSTLGQQIAGNIPPFMPDSLYLLVIDEIGLSI